jgi:predicted metal-dependent peptidase
MSHLEQEKNHRDAQNGEQGQGSGGGSLEKQLDGFEMDDHGMFGEMDALDQAMLEHNIKTAVENAKGDGAGKLPNEVEEMLRLKKKPTVSWKRELRQFIGAGVRAETRTTRSKRNRRYGIIQPGHKRDHIAKILVVLDTSGSMYGERTEKVLSELYGIYQATPNLQLDVVECDAQIQEVFTYNGKDELKITGRGGTQMTPGLIYARENKYDGVIFLTDGEFWNEDFESNNKVKSLWVIADNAGYTSPIGKTIHLKSK